MNDDYIKQAAQEQIAILEELQRRQSQPINRYVPSNEPEHNQLSFHESEARWRLLTGGNQSGKSMAGAAEIAMWAMGQHKYQKLSPGPKQIWAISAEYRTLTNGIWRHLRPDAQIQPAKGAGFITEDRVKRIGPKLPQTDLPAYIEVWYNKKAGEFSRIDFISGDGGESARKRMQSAAVDLISVDEEIPSNMYDEIRARLLATNGRMIITATLVRSEDWILDVEDRANEGHSAYFHCALNLEKNRYINQDAIHELMGDLSPEERAVRVLGKSRRQFGLVYSTFLPDHLIDPFPIPDNWPKWAAFDPGFRIFAGLWMTQDPETKQFYIYREMYMKEATLYEVAQFITKVEGWEYKEFRGGYKRQPLDPEKAEVVEKFIDPNAAKHFEDGRAGVMIQLASEWDLPCIPADNDKHAGIEACRRMLMKDSLTEQPMVKVFRDCTNFISERRSYKIPKDRSQPHAGATRDEPVKKNDHLMDCWRYLSLHLIRVVMGQNVHSRLKSPAFFTGGTTKMEDRYKALQNRGRDQSAHPFLGNQF